MNAFQKLIDIGALPKPPAGYIEQAAHELTINGTVVARVFHQEECTHLFVRWDTGSHIVYQPHELQLAP